MSDCADLFASLIDADCEAASESGEGEGGGNSQGPGHAEARLDLDAQWAQDLLAADDDADNSQGQGRGGTLARNRRKRWAQPVLAAAADGEDQVARPAKRPRVADQEGDSQDASAARGPSSSVGKIAAEFFSGDALRTTFTHASGWVGSSPYVLKTTMLRLAAVAHKAQDWYIQTFLAKVLACCEPRQAAQAPDQRRAALRARLFMHVRQYDETPIQLRVVHASDNSCSGVAQPSLPLLPLCQQDSQESQSAAPAGAQAAKPTGKQPSDTHPCKLFVTEQRWAALFAADGNAQTSFQIEGQLATPLQVLASNTGDLIARALWQSRPKCWDELVNHSFERVLHIVTSDDFSGNHAAEHILSQHEEAAHPSAQAKIGKLHITCDVHKVHGIAKATFDLQPFFTSGLVKSALALRSGQMPKFRAVLRQVVAATQNLPREASSQRWPLRTSILQDAHV